MYVKTSQKGVSGLRRQASVCVAVAALAATLALGGCRTGAAHTTSPSTHGAGSISNGAGSTTGSSNSSSLQQLQSIDSQNQSDTQQLSGAQSSAGVDYSSQENQTQP